METKLLEEIGLTRTEIAIYLTLMKLGQATTTPIITNSGINASKVYELLSRLVKKGLVSYIVKNNKKYFRANPEALKHYLDSKEEELESQKKKVLELIPELKSLHNKEEKINAEVFEGLEGIKEVYGKILELGKGDKQYIIGAPRIGNELIEGFLLDWHKKRIKKGIICNYIYNSDVRDYGRIRENMPLTNVKYFDKIISPVWIEIFGDYVATCHIKGHSAVIFLINDKEIAKSYKSYFELLWKLARK